MTRNAAQTGLARRVLASSFGLGLFLAGAAQAGDRAQLSAIGYSPDARHFAFEEYGIQEGSGFPYSTIYVVDLAEDEWVSGSPFHIVLQDEGDRLPDLRTARQEAAEAASSMLERLDIGSPAQIVALIGDGALDDDGHSLEFGAPHYMPGEVTGRYELSLDTFDAQSPQPCEDYLGESAKGFTLTLEGEDGTREVFRDETLPDSRGCPLDYRLFGVFSPLNMGGLSGAVVMVSSYPFGFEGPDRRFIAIPLGE